MTEPMRLNRALSVLGAASRRQAEELIRRGRVRCNDRVVTDPAYPVDLARDRILLDGHPLQAPSARYVALHKPAGVVTTLRDPHAARTVGQLIPGPERLFPVGRLDRDSEGLLLLTNDGAFANLVAHPRYEVEKEYRVLIAAAPTPAALARLRRGIVLDGRPTAPARITLERSTADGVWLRISLREGRKREVRRMLAAVGHEVRRLIRVRIDDLELGDLPPGAWRDLTPDEVARLRAGRHETRSTRADLGHAAGPPNPFRSAPTSEPASGGEHPVPPGQQPKRRRDGQGTLRIAIDGPSGAGKTTVGTALAKRLDALFLDTGLLYRALALAALRHGVSPDDASALAALAMRLKVEVEGGAAGSRVLLEGEDVSSELHTPEVDAVVSRVAAHAAVRRALIPAQQRAARATRAVVVGRDIGTVIMPDADLKVFLDATQHERARRRARQRGQEDELPRVEHEVAERDRQDAARSVAPLVRAADAIVVNTDGCSVEEVVERILANIPLEPRDP